MFQIVSLIVFLAVLGGIGLHVLLFPCGAGRRFTCGALGRKAVHLLTLLFLPQSLTWVGRLRKLAFLLGLLSFVVLLLTGFLPPLLGGRLEGYWLMVHATFAPIFIACVAFIVVTAADQYRFVKRDSVHLAALYKNRKTRQACWLTDSEASAKAGFWLLAALSLPMTLTMVLSMTTLFGTDGQEWLFETHRWSALAFSVFTISMLYVLIRHGVRKDADIQSEDV